LKTPFTLALVIHSLTMTGGQYFVSG
jgi:hypothetical protein